MKVVRELLQIWVSLQIPQNPGASNWLQTPRAYKKTLNLGTLYFIE